MKLDINEKMKEFPKGIKFKYKWRKYQERVLNELESHLVDDHLHVVAPPGSGKTILGLEVMLRLNKPTLILAPTVAIRNQWIQRFCELFLQQTDVPAWISRDIRNPEFLTVVTYQGLHTACTKQEALEVEIEDEEGDGSQEEHFSKSSLNKIVKGLKKKGVKNIVVDEAHHLKNEWWKTLTAVKNELKPIVVGLTATPPYDVSVNEWHRYVELNGPVDTEITVPELVVEGDLCPHQDYVYLTWPSKNEHNKIVSLRKKIAELFEELKADETLIKAIEQTEIWKNPQEKLDWIYGNLSFYSACIIFLNANGKEIPKTHLEIIGDGKIEIPALDYEWFETLLNYYLKDSDKHFEDLEEHRLKLENRLKRNGALERNKIDFTQNQKIASFLKTSISKLNGIQNIVEFEYDNLGSDLRLVVLTDYIRKEFLVEGQENNLELTKIGVLPIFEKLRRDNHNEKKIGVLTGSTVIIPSSALSSLKKIAKDYGIDEIDYSELPFDPNYLLINKNEQIKHDVVHIITTAFHMGEIEVLIGTKSLLGEGWDAPALNALILASFVGSFVLSNQMRGRAIRAQKANEDKTGNIWHLVCIDPNERTGGYDFELLNRRFKSFVGISNEESPTIENGLSRLKIENNYQDESAVDLKNEQTLKLAAQRNKLGAKWQLALSKGMSLVEEIKLPYDDEKPYQKAKRLFLNKTIANLVAMLSYGFGIYLLESLELFARVRSKKQFYLALVIFSVLGLWFFGRLSFKTLRLYISYKDISKDIKNIAQALLKTLCEVKLITTPFNQLKVEAKHDEWGAVFCHLEGGNTFDKSTFINALQEIIDPIDNPRYVIIRKSRFMMLVKQRDYHAVPEAIARKKEMATTLKKHWLDFVGKCELVYTRTIEGRKLLLKWRVKSLASQFESKIERVNKWN